MKTKEQLDAFIQEQCSGAIDACEKYEYPTSDEPLCCLIEDVIRNTLLWVASDDQQGLTAPSGER